MKEQHCTMFVANNGYNYDVIMGFTSYFTKEVSFKLFLVRLATECWKQIAST